MAVDGADRHPAHEIPNFIYSTITEPEIFIMQEFFLLENKYETLMACDNRPTLRDTR